MARHPVQARSARVSWERWQVQGRARDTTHAPPLMVGFLTATSRPPSSRSETAVLGSVHGTCQRPGRRSRAYLRSVSGRQSGP